jgi:hypothetical protein
MEIMDKGKMRVNSRIKDDGNNEYFLRDHSTH